MIIACPACGTRYDIPDTAIGPNGRKLKCAACGNGWHVNAVGVEDDAFADPMPPIPPAPLTGAATPAHDPEPREVAPPPAAAPEPEARRLPVAPVVPAAPAMSASAPDPLVEAPSPFDYQPPLEPAASGLRWLWWLIGAIVLLVALAGLAYGLDLGGVRERLGAVRTSAASPLVVRFTATPMRRAMDSGNELLAIAGQVVNTTGTAQRVPDIRAELRDAQGRTVYDWTIGAPVQRLSPGQSAEFNAAEVDVPAAARTVHLRPGALPQV